MTPEQIAKSGTEHAIQSAFFAALVPYYEMHPELRLMFAIPNGGQRNPATAGRLKAEGVKAGIPDVFLPVARHSLHGLWIEFKKVGGKLSDKQIQTFPLLAAQGYVFYVVESWQDALQIVLNYLHVND